jgi:hypothetical protein
VCVARGLLLTIRRLRRLSGPRQARHERRVVDDDERSSVPEPGDGDLLIRTTSTVVAVGFFFHGGAVRA